MVFRIMVICIMNIYYLSLLSKDAPIVFVFSFLLYVLGKKNPLAIPSVCCYQCPPFLKNNHGFYINLDCRFEKRVFVKYFKNSIKIF